MNRLILSLACLSLAGLTTAGCTFKSGSTIDDDNVAGSGGEGGGGSGGDAGTGGTGGTDQFESNMVCEADAPDRAPGVCDWLNPNEDNPCEACLEADCCEEFSACDADIQTQCFYGGRDLDDDGLLDGEWFNVLECLVEKLASGDDTGTELDDCLEANGTPECGGSASVATENLAVCALSFCEVDCLTQ